MFTNNVKSYLNEKFIEGERTKRKYDPRKLAEQMETETITENGISKPRFLPDELKNYKEIASYFSRKTSKMRTVAGCIEDPAMASCPDGDPETTEEGEPDMDFIHDPLFPDQAQELLEAIREYDENRSSGPRHQSENQDQSKITTSQPITTLSQHIHDENI